MFKKQYLKNYYQIFLSIILTVLLGVFSYYFFQILALKFFMPCREDEMFYLFDARNFALTGSLRSILLSDENHSIIFGVGTHGPAYVFLNGIIYFISGLNSKSIIVANVLYLSALFIFYGFLKSFNLEQKLTFSALMLSMFGFLTFTLSFMQENIHLMFAGFIIYFLIKIHECDLNKNFQLKQKYIYAFLFLILLATCFRFSWCLFSFCLLAFSENKKSFFQNSLIILAYVVFGVLYLKFFHASYNQGVIYSFFKQISDSNFIGALDTVIKNFLNNLKLFFVFKFNDFAYYSTKMISLFGFFYLLLMTFKKRSKLLLSVSLISGIYFFMLFALYDCFDYREIRSLGTVLVIFYVVFVYEKKYIACTIILVLNMISFPLSMKGIFNESYTAKLACSQLYQSQSVQDFGILRNLANKHGDEFITVLLPKEILYTHIPNTPLTIKNIATVSQLSLPTKNINGIPMRYTYNASSDKYFKHGKIEIDYIIDQSGRLIEN